MAFGSWFKNITKKVANGFRKALPVIQTIGKIAANVLAPGMTAAGGILGGSFGDTISGWGNELGKVTGRFNDFVNNSKPISPATFATPMIK